MAKAFTIKARDAARESLYVRTIKARDAARESLYVRLAPTMIDRLNALQKDTGVNRADIIQQALEYALEHLEVEGRVSE